MKLAQTGPLSLGLGVVAAACLGFSGYVHLDLSDFYSHNPTGSISQQAIFIIQGIAVIALGIALLAAVTLQPAKVQVLLFAVVGVTLLGSLGAVVFSYYNHTDFLGLPDMYEHTWDTPNKTASAIIEGAGGLVALVGAGVTRIAGRTAGGHAHRRISEGSAAG
jgi:hypothetical protein